MKIAFNIDYDHTKPTGIGRYGLELIKAWNKIGNTSELWMARTTKEKPLDFSNLRMKTRYFPFPRRITNYFWPLLTCKTQGISWIHSTNGMILRPSYQLKQVAMIHDLGPFKFGHMKDRSDTEPWKIRIKTVAEYADCITVNSTATKVDLLYYFPKTKGKVFVTPLGIDHFDSKKSLSEKSEKQHILCVGTVEPRKNIDGLIKAYSILHQTNNSLPKLVIAGMDGYKSDEYKQLTNSLNLAEKVVFTGFVSDETLTTLYSNAYCLVHPAHHEGFGFTIPEAFTWNLPVVASKVGGISEFFSKSSWMVDPTNVESIASGINLALEKGVTPEQNQERESIQKNLTWDNCARKTLEAMQSIEG